MHACCAVRKEGCFVPFRLVRVLLASALCMSVATLVLHVGFLRKLALLISRSRTRRHKKRTFDVLRVRLHLTGAFVGLANALYCTLLSSQMETSPLAKLFFLLLDVSLVFHFFLAHTLIARTLFLSLSYEWRKRAQKRFGKLNYTLCMLNCATSCTSYVGVLVSTELNVAENHNVWTAIWLSSMTASGLSMLVVIGYVRSYLDVFVKLGMVTFSSSIRFRDALKKGPISVLEQSLVRWCRRYLCFLLSVTFSLFLMLSGTAYIVWSYFQRRRARASSGPPPHPDHDDGPTDSIWLCHLIILNIAPIFATVTCVLFKGATTTNAKHIQMRKMFPVKSSKILLHYQRASTQDQVASDAESVAPSDAKRSIVDR